MAPGQQRQPGRLPTDLIAAGLTISRPNYIEKQSPGTGKQGNTGHLVPSASGLCAGVEPSPSHGLAGQLL